MSPVLRKYGVGTTIIFPLFDVAGVDQETAAAHASGDSQISKDEGAFANTTNAFSHEGNGIYSLALSATEMQAARIAVTIIDQTAPKVWLDRTVLIETYGNASGQHAFDLGTATQNVNVSQISGDSTAADNLEADYDGTGYAKSNSTTGLIDNAITAAKIATDAIGSDELAASAITEIQSGLATAASIAALNNLSAAQVNAEVVDVLTVDTFAELSSLPSFPATILNMVKWVFTLGRHRNNETATQHKVYKVDGTTVIGTSTTSDDGTTAEHGVYS